MFNFTPLLGAQCDSSASQSLLEFDGGVKVLVDVGWDASFDAEKLQALEQHVSTLSVVLLTHPTIDHIGAYAHCCKHVPFFSKIPVYATTPVINLGRSLLVDLYASSPIAASIIPALSITTLPPSTGLDSTPNLLYTPPTADEIATYFNRINHLKYSQPHQPIPSPSSPPLGNLTVTAYSAGHTPGGTIWHIQHSLESIVYATDWNQGRENLLSGAAWLGGVGGGAEIIEPLQRPTALICSSKGVEKTDVWPRKKRDEALVSLVRETIAQSGKVLIPTDSSARVLELAFILNQAWRENISGPHADTFKSAKIYMASKTSSSTVRQLQSMLEWMDEAIIRDAEGAANRDQGDEKSSNLLDWKFITQIERKSQLERALRRSAPCVLLASDSSLEWGFARQALERLSSDVRNLVIITDTASAVDDRHPSLVKQISACWRELPAQMASKTGAKIIVADGRDVQLQHADTLPLEEDEDILYQQYLAQQRQLHSSLEGDGADDTTAAEIADDQSSESSESEDEDEDAEHQGKALNISVQVIQSNKRKVGISDTELGINVLTRSKSVHDYDVQNKRGREKMFPFVAHKIRDDDFGDVIKPEDYLRAEERDDINGIDMKGGSNQESSGVGQKRKWDDASVAHAGSKNRKAQKDVPDKRAKTDHEPDDIDALIARATGENGKRIDGAASDASESDSDYEPEQSAIGAPKKVNFSTRSLSLRLRISYIDFSGMHERRDLQMLIPLIRPRKLILIAGTSSETQSLSDECKQLLGGEGHSTDVFAPAIGEMIDASVDTNAWTLKLSRQLVKKLTWQNVKGLGIVALTGRLDAEPRESTTDTIEGNANKKLKSIKGEVTGQERTSEMQPAMPVLDLVNTASSGASGIIHQRATQPVHVGDLRIADLRRLLTSSGHTADFRGEGTLLVDSTVIVRKSITGIEVEAGAGGLSQPTYRTKEMEGSFYAVRKLIYSGLAVVAGV